MLEKLPITIPELTGNEERTLYIYTPDQEGPFPVLYMFDGQNLFEDEDASFGKSWGLLSFLQEYEVPLMVVGAECNHHSEDDPFGRLSEYSPFSFSDPHFGDITGRGEITMNWYVNTLKPYIDDNYPTLSDRAHTFIGGSSMGGLMTLYALCAYSKVYSRGAALSPSLNFCPEEVQALIRKTRFPRSTVLYMDCGEKEMPYEASRRNYADVCSLLIRKKVLLESRIVPSGIHSEASWEKQVPFFMDVLFYHLKGFY